MRRAVRDGGSRRSPRDGRSTAETRLSREGAVRDTGRGRGARRSLEDRNPSWSRAGTPNDIERALDVAERRSDRRQAATWEHGVVLEAEQAFPDAPSTGWRRTGESFLDFTETGRPARRLTRTLSDRALVLAIAAERPEPPAAPGLVKRMFEWLRERVERLLGRFRPSKAAHRQDPSGGDAGRARAAAAKRAPAERDLAGQLITAARTAARKWGDIPAGYGHPHLRRSVDQQPAESVSRSAAAPRSATG